MDVPDERRFPQFAVWFTNLINDRVGAWASKIKQGIMGYAEAGRFPVRVSVSAANRFTYTIDIKVENGRLLITSELVGPYIGAFEAPTVDVPDPATWTKLQEWRVANLIDRAFRDHAGRFDSQIP